MRNKFILIVLAIAASIILPSFTNSNKAQAQLITQLVPIAANDTLTNADTAWVYITTSVTGSKTFSATASVASELSRSVTVRVIKVSGTVAGSVTFSGSNDATNWETIGSALSLTDVADQVKTFDMRSGGGDLLYTYYRAVFIGSGTNVHIPKVYYLRRN